MVDQACPSPGRRHPDLQPSAVPTGAAGEASTALKTATCQTIPGVSALFGFATRRWLLAINGALALYLGLAVGAPLLLRAGLADLAEAIYAAYRMFCHQLPYRSFFFFGPQAVYTKAELASMPNLGPAALEPGSSFFGSAALGYKMAFCERDLALYGAILLAGLTFAILRGRLRPLAARLYLLAMLPIAIDGFTQLFGWRESTWELRVLTGVIFGAATVWFAYPYVDVAMADTSRQVSATSHQPAAVSRQ